MSIRRFFRRIFPKTVKPLAQRFEVGRGTYGEPNVLHWGEPSTLKVGAFCSFAPDVDIFLGGNHRTDWITTYPFPACRVSAKNIPGHPATRGDVVIGHDVWVGTGATIMSGVRLGNGSVVGACSVVTRDVPAYGIVAGNPAKLIRFRFSENDIACLEEIAWWNWTDAMIDEAMPYLLSPDISALRSFAESKAAKV